MEQLDVSLIAAIRSSSQPPEPQFLIWDTLEARIYHREAQISIRKALQNCESVFKQWQSSASLPLLLCSVSGPHERSGKQTQRWRKETLQVEPSDYSLLGGSG